jgi:hypothetical protein
VDSSSKGQRSFICRKEKGKAIWGHAVGPGNQWSTESGWKLVFIAFLLLEGGDFGVDTCEGEMSPWCKKVVFGKEKGHFSPLAN